ncbi:MAG: C40 family peptidase [Betaproteobacteria bacterium]|nr:C40 family peptidase [Betaproteobacteria bacterium]MBI2961918.1 C40 family peptidase [Betaproteobacteria bacterium]
MARSPAIAPAPQLPARAPSSGHDADLLFQAIAAAGVEYRNGGHSYATGFDCSGLVAFVFRQAYGLELPHNSRAQSTFGEAVDAQNLQAGDLVFFNTQGEPYSHVGIYLGEDKFIHAPRTGSPVRTENMRARYWATRFDGARRIAPAIVPVDYAPAPKKPHVTYP